MEGFRLLPHLVKPLLDEPDQAVWLLPVPEFRQVVFDRRGGTAWAFLARTSDPEKALSNLLERDRLFTQRLSEQIRLLELPCVAVDSQMTEDALEDRVAAVFGLAPQG